MVPSFSYSEVTNISEIYETTKGSDFKQLLAIMNKAVEAMSSNFSMSSFVATGNSCK